MKKASKLNNDVVHITTFQSQCKGGTVKYP